MKSMVAGRMYCLNSILKILNREEDVSYILLGAGECDYSICFGRNRKLNIPKDSYIVRITKGGFELEKIEFDCSKQCDYLKKLSKNNIEYEIPKSLPVCVNRMYNRFECAIGATHWSKLIRGFFGKNGYAITDLSYVGDDRYESFEINLNKTIGSLHIGEYMITRMTGYDIPKDQFIEKLLMEEIRVEEGEPFLEMIHEAGMMSGLEHIIFETD